MGSQTKDHQLNIKMITALLSSLLVSLASSAEIFNLQDPRFRSLNSRIPNSCSTQSGRRRLQTAGRNVVLQAAAASSHSVTKE